MKVNIALLTVTDTRTLKTDKSGNILVKKIKKAQHNLVEREICKDSKKDIKKILKGWLKKKKIDVIITTGGTGLTGSDVTPEALEEIFEKTIDGFSIIFHQISYKKIKTSTVQSRATAGIYNSKFIFALPGSPNAVADGWDEILKFQLDSRHQPCNFVDIMPRLTEIVN